MCSKNARDLVESRQASCSFWVVALKQRYEYAEEEE